MKKIMFILVLMFLFGCSLFIKPEAEVQIWKDTSCNEGYSVITRIHGEVKEKECISKRDFEDFMSMTVEHSNLEDKGNPSGVKE